MAQHERVDTRPHDNERSGRTNMDSAAWDDRYAEASVHGGREANRFVVEYLSDVPPGSALDLGAGAGRNAVWLAERGWRVRAVDFSSVALEQARQSAQQCGVTIETELADVTSYDPEPSEWDLVLVCYLQLPTEQRRELLVRASRWVGPGGLLFVVGHDRANVAGGYGGPRSEEVSYTPEETVRALDGLAIATAGTVERLVKSEQGDRIALDTVVLAKRAPLGR